MCSGEIRVVGRTFLLPGIPIPSVSDLSKMIANLVLESYHNSLINRQGARAMQSCHRG